MRSALIADESEVIRLVTAGLVEKLGYQCELAENNEDALQIIEEQEFSLIIVDWNLQISSAFEVLNQVNVLGLEKKRPLCIVTMMEEKPEAIKAAKEKGGDHILIKPYSLDELKIIINENPLIQDDANITA